MTMPPADRPARTRARRIILSLGDGILSPEQKAALQALGPDAVEELADILRDERLLAEESEGGGFAPAAAAHALGALEAAEAVPALIAVLGRAPRSGSMSEVALSHEASRALVEMGSAAFDAVLLASRHHPDARTRAALCWVVAEVGRGDARAYERLVDELEIDPENGAVCFQLHADPRAVEPLSDALRRAQMSAAIEPKELRGIVELANAVVLLGGSLPEPTLKKVRRARARLEEVQARRSKSPSA